MRGNRRNSGALEVPCNYTGGHPWSVPTGRGVFSTPVIDAAANCYVGSADGTMYAVDAGGEVLWRFATGGVIDSAGLLVDGGLIFGSGDEWLYCLDLDASGAEGSARERWRLRALPPEAGGQQVAWWEGNVVAGPGATLLAGNTAGHAYAVTTGGELVWAEGTGNAIWTAAAVGEDGTSYWGSLDLHVRALDAEGTQLWATPTLGFVVSSPALSSEGVLYTGSFDGSLYALDATTGRQLWTFATSDSIYSSPALVESQGTTEAIIVASTDGCVYAVDARGSELWRYDTGAIVRSSPALSRGPGGDGWVAYVGAANGTLYALDVASGRRRWSIDLTSSDEHLADRRSLNGSPALSRSGVCIASEDGSIWHVPFDYPLHSDDPRGSIDPGEPMPEDCVRLGVVTPGGVTTYDEVVTFERTAVIALRLQVRDAGRSIDAVLGGDLVVSSTPPTELTWRASGDGHHLFVRARDGWPADAEIALSVSGTWQPYGPDGGPSAAREFAESARAWIAPMRTTPPGHLEVGSTLRLWRLAVSLPSFAASVNQIGFDSYDWLVKIDDVVAHDDGRSGTVCAHVRGARRDGRGDLVADPTSPFDFHMEGSYSGDAVRLVGSGVVLPFSFGEVPTDHLELAFSLDPLGAARPGASMYAEVIAADVPFYGPLLVAFTRLADRDGRMVTAGTFLIEAVAAPES